MSSSFFSEESLCFCPLTVVHGHLPFLRILLEREKRRENDRELSVLEKENGTVQASSRHFPLFALFYNIREKRSTCKQSKRTVEKKFLIPCWSSLSLYFSKARRFSQCAGISQKASRCTSNTSNIYREMLFGRSATYTLR